MSFVILAYMSCALALLSRFRSTWLVRCTAVIGLFLALVLTGFYLVADYFTGNGVDSSVVYHLKSGLQGAGWLAYPSVIGFALVAIIVSILLPVILLRKFAQSGANSASVWSPLIALTLPLSLLLHPAISDLYTLYDIRPFRLGIHGDAGGKGKSAPGSIPFADVFRRPMSSALAPQPLNLVFIYLESLERTYFDESLFPGLVPNLAALEKESLHFTDLRNFGGSGFTIGGMVASQCGIPMPTLGYANSNFGMDKFLPGVRCIGDILKDAGFGMHYMGGADSTFAGKGKFYHSHGFDAVTGLKELALKLPEPGYRSPWGLYDDFFLDQVYQRFEALSRVPGRFGLFALTMDTHHPRGHRSATCGSEYGDGGNELLNAVHCADRLVAEFIRRVRSSPFGGNTLLILASDHLALNNQASGMLKRGTRRNLMMVFHPSASAGRQVAKPGMTLDIAPTVLGMMGAKDTAVGLGRDLLADTPNLLALTRRPAWQLNLWQPALKDFWQLPSVRRGVHIDLPQQTVTIDGRNFMLPVVIQIDSTGWVNSLNFQFDNQATLAEQVRQLGADQLIGWIDECAQVRAMDLTLRKTGYCAFFGSIEAGASISTALDDSFVVGRSQLLQLIEGPLDSAHARQRLENLQSVIDYGFAGVTTEFLNSSEIGAVSKLRVLSSGGPEELSLITTSVDSWRPKRGLSLLAISSDGKLRQLARVDGCASGSVLAGAKSFAEQIRSDAGNTTTYLLMVHDSAICADRDLAKFFRGLPLTKWQQIGLRTPYIALLSRQQKPLAEFVGKRDQALALTEADRTESVTLAVPGT